MISWYAASGGSYQLQDNAIKTYLAQVGSSNHISVQNMTQAIAVTKTALTSAKPLEYTLVAVPVAPVAAAGPCQRNAASKFILVSISQQHMWVCQGGSQVNESAITSGAYALGDATPTGTWHIYGKSRNVHLIGPTWNDFVQYWMPFYGAYGFHDASWQTFPYGSPDYASEGSHGCIHVPLSVMVWLYNWSSIGTTVTVSA